MSDTNDMEALRRDAARYRRLKSFALPRYVVHAQANAPYVLDAEVVVFAESWEQMDAYLDGTAP